MQVVGKRRPESPTVSVHHINDQPFSHWLSSLSEESQRTRSSAFKRFTRWVTTQPGYESLLGLEVESQAKELLLRHLQNIDQYDAREGGYIMVDFVESYIRSQHGKRKKSKMRDLTDIRSFFSANRADLPPDKRFIVRGDKPPVVSLLRPEIIRKAGMALDPMYQSALLCRWQGFLDMKRLLWVNMNCAGDIVKQLRSKKNLVYIWIPGRKHYENDPEGDFYTWWGKDAIDALANYFDNKFMRDVDYVRQQYLIAEPWLNIISNPNPDIAAIENEKMKTMQQRIEALEQTVKRYEKMSDTKVTLPR